MSRCHHHLFAISLLDIGHQVDEHEDYTAALDRQLKTHK
jgi:hypothetical protein